MITKAISLFIITFSQGLYLQEPAVSQNGLYFKMEFTPDEDAPELTSEPYGEMAELANARRESYRPHIDPGSGGFSVLSETSLLSTYRSDSEMDHQQMNLCFFIMDFRNKTVLRTVYYHQSVIDRSSESQKQRFPSVPVNDQCIFFTIRISRPMTAMTAAAIAMTFTEEVPSLASASSADSVVGSASCTDTVSPLIGSTL